MRGVNKKISEQKSNAELEEYIRPGSRYVAQAIKYAFEILQSRGREFSEEEKQEITKQLQEREQSEQKELYWDKSVLGDPNVPVLYSQSALWAFSICFGVLPGAILLAINFNELKNRKMTILTVLFGLFFSGIHLVLRQYLMLLTSTHIVSMLGWNFLFTGIGAAILHLFWNTSIIKELVFRKRSVLIPGVICVIYALWGSLLYFGNFV
ncbi:hypothetical protein ACR776_10080 [Sphingobacterium spiritivorum]|uniref:hypothetical protein n=1 Tax=Sphingobacterium spiritivorum TaxID=258 RepID=UPI003DA51053